MNYFNYMNGMANMGYMENMNTINNMKQNENNKNLYDPYQGFIRGNLFKNLYDPYKLNKPYDIEPANEQAKMLTSIDALSFAMRDLNLYLDINPNSREYIDLFNKYRVQKNELVKEYASRYGPLTLDSDAMFSYPWAWDKSPFPWEN